MGEVPPSRKDPQATPSQRKVILPCDCCCFTNDIIRDGRQQNGLLVRQLVRWPESGVCLLDQTCWTIPLGSLDIRLSNSPIPGCFEVDMLNLVNIAMGHCFQLCPQCPCPYTPTTRDPKSMQGRTKGSVPFSPSEGYRKSDRSMTAFGVRENRAGKLHLKKLTFK